MVPLLCPLHPGFDRIDRLCPERSLRIAGRGACYRDAVFVCRATSVFQDTPGRGAGLACLWLSVGVICSMLGGAVGVHQKKRADVELHTACWSLIVGAFD